MGNKELTHVYEGMAKGRKWWSISDLAEKYGLTFGQRDHFRQDIRAGRTGFKVSIKRVGTFSCYKMTKYGDANIADMALSFKPTSSSMYLAKHG
jgi:hypothetical protein